MTIDRNNPEPTQYHPSFFEGYRYVYPVVSRRANGVSLGVNLSPTKLCNFRCVYCQIDRQEKPAEIFRAVAAADPAAAGSLDVIQAACADSARSAAMRAADLDLDVLRHEISRLAQATLSGDLFATPRFANVAENRRVLRDFAFSGDGEPTLARQFPQVVDLLAGVRRELNYDPLKLVLITNATRLQRPEIADALDRFCDANGELWVKIDAGDPARLKTINRTAVPLETILGNIAFAARRWRIKVQTALFSWKGQAPTDEEFMSYASRLRDVLGAGGNIQSVQLYTVARVPAEPDAEPLDNDAMDRYAEILRRETGLDAETFYSH